MHTIQEQDQIQIAVTGTLDNGAVFMENGVDDPLVITVGSGTLPPSVEARLIGKSIGDIVKARVSPDEGFGPQAERFTAQDSPFPFSGTNHPKTRHADFPEGDQRRNRAHRAGNGSRG